MATLKNSIVGCICIGRTCASSNGHKTVRLGACCSGDGALKTAVGYYASNYSSGAQLTAFGTKALQRNTGGCNTGIGGLTLAVGTGDCNTAVGHNASRCSTTAGCGVSAGYRALFFNTTGNRNVAVGSCSAKCSTTGSKNTFVGYGTCAQNSSANQTVVIGSCAFANGTYGVAIGFSAHTTNAGLAIGNGAFAANNKISWGAAVNNVCNCVWGTWSYISDCRDKADITDIDDNLGINFIRKLKPVNYKIDNRKSYVQLCNYEYGTKDGNLKRSKRSYGFIAQEVKDAADELNIQFEGVKYSDEIDAYRLSYSQLLASIVKTIKTIDERIQVLKTKI
jgi:hypothetical protein